MDFPFSSPGRVLFLLWSIKSKVKTYETASMEMMKRRSFVDETVCSANDALAINHNGNLEIPFRLWVMHRIEAAQGYT